MRYETLCFAHMFCDFHLFFRIYEQKTQLVIESEGAKCRPTENLKIPSSYQRLLKKKVLDYRYNLAGFYHELSKNKIPTSSLDTIKLLLIPPIF